MFSNCKTFKSKEPLETHNKSKQKCCRLGFIELLWGKMIKMQRHSYFLAALSGILFRHIMYVHNSRKELEN